MIDVINTLAPAVLIIALGVYLGRSGFMPERKAIWANQLTYWVALPCLLFTETAHSKIDLASGGNTLLVILGAMSFCIIVAYLMAYLLKLPPISTGAFVQAGFRGNLAYIGIPVVMYSVGRIDKQAASLCMLVVAGAIPFTNLAAVIVLLAGRQQPGLAVVGTVMKQFVKNPLILSSAAGVAFSLLGATLPAALSGTLVPLGKMALPLALLSIGVTLDVKKIHGLRQPIFVASVIKVVLSPLIGWGLASLIALSPTETRIALIMLATPTATAGFIMADLMKSDSHLTSGVIVVSTLLSLVPNMIITWALG